MSKEKSFEQTSEVKRIYSDMSMSSGDDEPVRRKYRLLSDLLSIDGNAEISVSPVNVISGEAVDPVKSGKAVPVRLGKVRTKSAQDKKCSKPKYTTMKRSCKKRRSECSTSASIALMDDVKKFSKSLIKEFKAEGRKMLAHMKKELEKLAARNHSKKIPKNKGKGLFKTGEAAEKQKSTQSEPQLQVQENDSSSKNCILPAGLDAGSAMGAVNHHGYISNSHAQAPDTHFVQNSNFAQMGPRDLGYVYRNTIPASSMGSGLTNSSNNIPRQTVAADNGSGIPYSLLQYLGYISNIPADFSSGGSGSNGGAMRFSGRGRALSNTVRPNNISTGNNYHDNRNLRATATEALLRLQDPRNGGNNH